jgi:hypothetical protein
MVFSLSDIDDTKPDGIYSRAGERELGNTLDLWANKISIRFY